MCYNKTQEAQREILGRGGAMFHRFTAFAALPLLLVAGEIGTLQYNVYHHNRTGIEFTLPAG
jgi:hypothetical protein